MDAGLLLLRLVFGLVLASHGAQKLFGWFGGGGIKGTGMFFGKLGFEPGQFYAVIAGLTEFVGGLLLALGLLWPLGPAMVVGVMLTAAFSTWKQGFFSGTETPLLIAAAGASLALTGPGRYSLDEGRPWRRTTTGEAWGWGAIALGVVASLIAMLVKG
ncbi:putative oxidoreductase [Actinocorallia herbida]|uniref:Putative oxidoreductase n=1 Tax=Actinocorallia herbida TaxID=58109 RepID=A0A3N1DAR1_9ACTN|nr:DoxX family membrane protein [Actinocorallia herbida]ROO90622.1 putative oxidoreductase [Actinocorallia herbida]